MYVQLTMAERLKDLRVIDKKLTLEQLAEQIGIQPGVKKTVLFHAFSSLRRMSSNT